MNVKKLAIHHQTLVEPAYRMPWIFVLNGLVGEFKLIDKFNFKTGYENLSSLFPCYTARDLFYILVFIAPF